MQRTHDDVATRRSPWLHRALMAAAILAGSHLPAFAGSAGGSAEGIASFYGREHHGGPTASGERFNMNAMTAAHRSAPLGSRLKVTNLRNGRAVVVRVNDRGPFVRGRIIDLSRGAAGELGFIGSGLTRVRVERVADATPTGTLEAGAPAPAKVAAAEATGSVPARASADRLDDATRLVIARNGG